MEEATVSLRQLVSTSKLLVRRLLTIAGNRMELLTVEVLEERLRLLRAILLALGVAALGLLAAIALTAAFVVLVWEWSPAGVLAGVGCLYAAAAAWLWRHLAALLRDWQNLPGSLDQLRKDRACLEKALE